MKLLIPTTHGLAIGKFLHHGMGIDGDINGILLAMGDTHSDLTHSDYDWGKHHGIAPQIPSKREKIGSPGI